VVREGGKPTGNPPPHGVDEKGNHDNESLIVEGWQRAGALAVFFAPSIGAPQNPRISIPSFVYASQMKKGVGSERPQETILPLIAKLGPSKVAANFQFSRGDENAVALSAMSGGGPVLICWDHENIPVIAGNFPISKSNSNPVPSEWPGARFDLVWVFELDDAEGGYCFTQVPQLLLAGDKK